MAKVSGVRWDSALSGEFRQRNGSNTCRVRLDKRVGAGSWQAAEMTFCFRNPCRADLLV